MRHFFFLAICCLVVAFGASKAFAQGIKGLAPDGTLMPVNVDASGNFVFTPSGVPPSIDVRVRDATTATSMVTVAAPGSDNVDPAAVFGMSVMSSGYCLDAGNKWDRVHCDSVAAAGCQCVAPPTDKYFMISGTTSANAATNPIHIRVSIDGTNPMDSTHPLTCSPTNAANTVSNPFYFSKAGTAVLAPTKTTTLAIAGTLVDVLASTEVLGYPNFCVTLKNNDAANPLTDAAIFQSPDGSAWESLSWTACDALAFATSCSYCVSGNAYRYIKVQAKADAILTVSTLDAWLTANVN
jgi:hypothetical protein